MTIQTTSDQGLNKEVYIWVQQIHTLNHVKIIHMVHSVFLLCHHRLLRKKENNQSNLVYYCLKGNSEVLSSLC